LKELSISGEPQHHTLWKRRYRARLLRESDPARFYHRRHKRKHRPKVRKRYQPLTAEDMAGMMLTADDFAAMVWSDN